MIIRWLLGVFSILTIAVLAACGSTPATRTPTPAGSAQVQNVQIDLSEYRIASSVTTFAPGTHYHFVVTNQGHTEHEFMIMPSSIGEINGMSMDKMALASVSDVDPGESKILDYTFPTSVAGTRPEFACHEPGHYGAGMKLAVNVQTA